MKTIWTLVLLAAMNAGCATGIGTDRPAVWRSDTKPPEPVEIQLRDGPAPGPSQSASIPSIAAPSQAIRMVRMLKCGAIGAVGGAVGGAAAAGFLVPYTGGLSIYLLPVIVPYGAVVGMKDGVKEGAKEGNCQLIPNRPGSEIKVQREQREG
jgi:hypothetical protein